MGIKKQLVGPQEDEVGLYLPYLKRANLLSALKENDDALTYLLGYMGVLDYPAKTDVITMGKRDGCMYILVQGAVEVFKSTGEGDHFLVARLSAEQAPYFGEGALLHDHPRSSSIRAATDAKCLILARSDFDFFCREKPDWGLPIIKHMAFVLSERIRKQAQDFVDVYNALVEEIRGES